MSEEIRFESGGAKLKRDVAEYRDASPTDRLVALLELSDLCEQLLDASSQRTRQRALLDQREQEERDSWKRFIRAHAAPSATADESHRGL